MLDEFVINNSNLKNRETQKYSLVSEIRAIGSDSIFYFGIFLLALFVLKTIPFLGGLINESNLGINEVVVSGIGFLNIFFIRVFNKFLSKVK
ncbi:MAG: hypothetical protein OQJ81_00145 [Melioribacteraceae bacterium]|nr:hypothetical protein [Melioribacteraceae bacterium]